MTTARLIAPDSGDYPVGMRDLEEPPSLYVLGRLDSAAGVAVVGTRRCTRYGVALAEAFGVAITEAGWSVVSGLARGIDAAAHRGCLRASGHGVGVLGTGVDVVYPKENAPIYAELIASGGAILSEYPPGTPPDRWRFPARNRIIAAVSGAVVVVEAAAKGGALITARLAAEIGRPVFVVPGDIDRPASEGCNRLIKDGAHPVLGAADLIEELSLVLGPPRARASSAQSDLPVGGLSVDQLPKHWSVTTTEALSRLTQMEIAGEIRRDGGVVYPT